MVHACNTSTQKAEARGSQVLSQPELLNETLFFTSLNLVSIHIWICIVYWIIPTTESSVAIQDTLCCFYVPVCLIIFDYTSCPYP
jgi:hypothetical protein